MFQLQISRYLFRKTKINLKVTMFGSLMKWSHCYLLRIWHFSTLWYFVIYKSITTTSKHGVALLKDIHVFKHLSKWKKNVFIMIRKNTESISISESISWYWASILIFVYIARKKVHYWYLKDKTILYDT